MDGLVDRAGSDLESIRGACEYECLPYEYTGQVSSSREVDF